MPEARKEAHKEDKGVAAKDVMPEANKHKEAVAEKKCVDASGKPAWCDAEGAMPATEEDVKKVKEAAPEKKCVDASGKPAWCDACDRRGREEGQRGGAREEVRRCFRQAS